MRNTVVSPDRNQKQSVSFHSFISNDNGCRLSVQVDAVESPYSEIFKSLMDMALSKWLYMALL